MKQICIIGHFGFGKELLNGQTIKTKTITKALEKQLGIKQIMKIDTHGGALFFPKILIQVVVAFFRCKNIIILPAHRGLRIFSPLCVVLNKIFNRRIHYIVIGGWLNKYLEDNKIVEKSLKSFTGVYVETKIMQRSLEKRGMNNIHVIRNFKHIRNLNEQELVYAINEPYRLCTFSRVMIEKGISDAVESVIAVNERYGRTVFKLDIYGQVDSEQFEWFDNLKASFPEYIQYKGFVGAEESVEVLKDYFLLLFPTRFYTEGIPGSIIDAYAAGIPVIASKWESFSDVIKEAETGIGYSFGNKQALTETLTRIYNNPQIISDMKVACLREAENYSEKGFLTELNKMINY